MKYLLILTLGLVACGTDQCSDTTTSPDETGSSSYTASMSSGFDLGMGGYPEEENMSACICGMGGGYENICGDCQLATDFYQE